MTLVIAAAARQEVADFVSALFFVYTIVVVAWVVVSLVLSLGLTPPYNRAIRAVLDFLHDTAEPFLRIFRRLPLRLGPLDLSPIVAIFVLRIVGNLVVSAID
jgi:YggT family protein